MKRLAFRGHFTEDLFHAAKWYEKQETGMGHKFLRSADSTLASIQEHPQLFAKNFKNIRSARIRRFPYNLYFSEDPDEIVVLALWHTSRRPGGWRRRINET